MRKYYAFFFLSGFCSLLYELVWLRLAMAQFGVTTPLISMVLSFFMAGLGLGSWAAGRWLGANAATLRGSRLRFYGWLELVIGLSALIVPLELTLGHDLLVQLGASSSFSSPAYYVLAGAILLITLLPWCAAMGATFAFGMFALEGERPDTAPRAFSYLYLANVLGAAAGAGGSLLLIELRGFTGALQTGACVNAAIAAWVFLWARRAGTPAIAATRTGAPAPSLQSASSASAPWLLFAVGLTSMGLEVTWTRAFTPFIGTLVYSFAAVLALYLVATWLGTHIYRRWGSNAGWAAAAWLGLALGAALPIITADPNLPVHVPHGGMARLFAGIVPFAMAAGFLTPMLVDLFAAGDPARAARAYTANVLGCIVGPLVAGFLLLPMLGERWSFFIFSAPWLAVAVRAGTSMPAPAGQARPSRAIGAAVALAGFALMLVSAGYESYYPGAQIRRDHTATVIALERRGVKHLLVNGVGITELTPIAKTMAHLPMALHAGPPAHTLVICFGMGTTHRSVLSWGGASTAVDLVPSVPALMGFFHPDGPALLALPRSRVVIDDGRRFLERTQDRFDVITLDPPPPVEAAGSSLLYSREFLVLASRHLNEDGLLQQWLPGGDDATVTAVAKAFGEVFPHVRVFRSIEGWGYHFIGGAKPIPSRSAEELAAQLPAPAAADLVEWGPEPLPAAQFALMLRHEMTMADVTAASPQTRALWDDHPTNEYYLLRRLWK